MSQRLVATISSDIDTLESIYKGAGCRRGEGYTGEEFLIGLENFSRFLEPYDVSATLFMVGRDFDYPRNHTTIHDMVNQGHEVANHTYSHAQGFRLLSPTEKETEIQLMEDACERVIGKRPIGFRSPGWNISDDALPILQKRGYLYDSSVFPTSLMPLLKFLHWRTMSARPKADRTTMGQWNYLGAPTTPYITTAQHLRQQGKEGIWEFPITVMPVLRLPFFATFLLSTGIPFFKMTYQALKRFQHPIQFMFHLSDFVDYTTSSLTEQVPTVGSGQYVPQALQTPLSYKLAIFREAMDIIAEDYEFSTFVSLAKK